MTSHQPRNNDVPGYQLHPDVVWIARPDGSAHLMHMSANVCAIDADSTALLTSIIEVGPERSASHLATRYNIDEAEAREQVEEIPGRNIPRWRCSGPFAGGDSPSRSGETEPARQSTRTPVDCWLGGGAIRVGHNGACVGTRLSPADRGRV